MLALQTNANKQTSATDTQDKKTNKQRFQQVPSLEGI